MCQGQKAPKRLSVENWNHENQPIQLNLELLPVEKKKQMELYRSKNVLQQFIRRTEFLRRLEKKKKSRTQFSMTVDREKMRKYIFLVLPNC